MPGEEKEEEGRVALPPDDTTDLSDGIQGTGKADDPGDYHHH